MQKLRLDEVLTRVVAWHNRHPLARRIQASQVHSIGEVLLPFASAQPLVAALAAATAPRASQAMVAPRPGQTLADVVSARAAARPAAAAATDALPGLELHSVLPDEPADPATAADLDLDLDLLPRQPGPDSTPEPPSEPGVGDGVGVGVGTGNGIEDADGGGAPASPIVEPQSEPDAAAVAAEVALDAALDSAAEAMAAAAADADAESAAALAALAAAPAATSVALSDDSPGGGLAGRLDEPLGFRAAPADDAVFAPGPVAEPARPDIDLSSSPTPASAAAAAPPTGAAPPALYWAAAAPVGWLRHIWARLTGRRPGWPRLEAAFSRDFIWPLTPQAVARWAQRHGQIPSLAPADWPRRQVAPDPARLGPLRQAGLAHTVQLRVLTAAIGVGDRRIRVLMDGKGHIIGPRAYSRPRSAAAAGLLMAALLSAGAGWPWGGLHPSGDGHRDGAAEAASAASAASAVSAALTASATSATAAVALAASAAGTPAAADPVEAALAASAAAAAHAASAADRAAGSATAARPTPAEAAARASPAHAGATAAALATAAATAPATAPETAPETAPATAPTPASPSPPPAGPAIEFASPANAAADTPRLGRIRPSLSDEERQVARGQAARLRETPGQAPVAPRNAPLTTATTDTGNTRATATGVSAKPAASPAPVYAVVTRPSRQRETAASGLVVMRSAAARLSPAAPEHSELMQQQGEWRAAWWPFARQVDAERARVMLAARGLKAEVVEF